MTILDLPTIRRGKHESTTCPAYWTGLECPRCEDNAAHIQADRIAADTKSHRSPTHSFVYEEWFDDLCARSTEGTHRAEAAAFERASA